MSDFTRGSSHEVRHKPVLPLEVLYALRPRPGHTVIDCTLGLGGHARLLLDHITPGGHLIGIDFDPHHIELAREHLRSVLGGNFTLHHGNFAALPSIIAAA